MRVTQAMMLSSALQSESASASRLAELTQQASTGQKVSQPSDDPAAWATIQDMNAQIGVAQARSSSATKAAGDLSLAETTLDAATNLLTQAKSLAVESANGVQTATSRADTAKQIQAIFQQLVGLANTRGSTGYLFGGTRTDQPPFDATGAFLGNAGTTHVEIADGVLAQSNASGALAFTASGGADVFAVVSSLQTALSTNDVAGIQSSLASLDGATAQMTSARIAAGVDAGRLQTASTTLGNALVTMKTALAGQADADIASTLTNLQETQTAYEAAISVNKQILSTALSGMNGG